MKRDWSIASIVGGSSSVLPCAAARISSSRVEGVAAGLVDNLGKQFRETTWPRAHASPGVSSTLACRARRFGTS
jgi:hypothetical protein